MGQMQSGKRLGLGQGVGGEENAGRWHPRAVWGEQNETASCSNHTSCHKDVFSGAVKPLH